MKKILIAIGVLTLLIGCSNNEKVVKIGVILPLTGPASEIGNDILDGIKIADKLENPNPEIRYEIIVEDSKLDPKVGISAATKLIAVDNVKAITGVAASPIALAVAPICEKNNIIMMSSTASTPLLSEAGDYVFRIYPSDSYDGKVLSDFAFKEKNIKDFSILYLNNDFGQGLKDVFIENYKQKGGVIKAVESFLPKDIDFRTQLLNIKKTNSNGLLIIAIDMQYINIIKQVRELNIDTEIFAPVTFDNSSIINSLNGAANGIYYSRPYYSLDESDQRKDKFIKEYRQLKGKEPSLLCALGYDSYTILVSSLSENNDDIDDTKASLYKIDYDGVSGNIKFDRNGDVIKSLEIMVIENEKAIKYGK